MNEREKGFYYFINSSWKILKKKKGKFEVAQGKKERQVRAVTLQVAASEDFLQRSFFFFLLLSFFSIIPPVS